MGLFGKKAPQWPTRPRQPGFWQRVWIFSINNAGFERVEAHFNSLGATVMQLGYRMRFNSSAKMVSFGLKNNVAEAVRIDDGSQEMCKWQFRFTDITGVNGKPLPESELNVLATFIEDAFLKLDPATKIELF